jgi:hypothetical protein
MDPKELGALVARERKKTDARAKPALSYYTGPDLYRGKMKKEDLAVINMTSEAEEEDAQHRAIVANQMALEEQLAGAKPHEDELPEVPVPLSTILE